MVLSAIILPGRTLTYRESTTSLWLHALQWVMYLNLIVPILQMRKLWLGEVICAGLQPFLFQGVKSKED